MDYKNLKYVSGIKFDNKTYPFPAIKILNHGIFVSYVENIEFNNYPDFDKSFGGIYYCEDKVRTYHLPIKKQVIPIWIDKFKKLERINITLSHGSNYMILHNNFESFKNINLILEYLNGEKEIKNINHKYKFIKDK